MCGVVVFWFDVDVVVFGLCVGDVGDDCGV